MSRKVLRRDQISIFGIVHVFLEHLDPPEALHNSHFGPTWVLHVTSEPLPVLENHVDVVNQYTFVV